MKKAHAFIGEIHNLQTADEVWNFATQSFSEIGLHRVSHGYVKDSGGEPQLDLRNNYPDFGGNCTTSEELTNMIYMRGMLHSRPSQF